MNEKNIPNIQSTRDLADLLNTTNQNLFRVYHEINSHYKRVTIPKRNGTNRVLHIPDDTLKSIQKKILVHILENIPVSKYATAYIKGKNLSANALPHIKHKYLLKIDIKDFFPSITYLQVYTTAFNSKIFPIQVGQILSSLCCRNDCLPQGTPTSPYLSNVVMKSFDNCIGEWCNNRDISYTRYCDDLTFSSNSPMGNLYVKVCDMLECMGFEINDRKTHFITNKSQQKVTGLVVNEKVSLPKDYKRNLRQELYFVEKYGIEDAIIKGGKHDFIKQDIPQSDSYYSYLIGKTNYVLQIEPNNKYFIEAKGKLISLAK